MTLTGEIPTFVKFNFPMLCRREIDVKEPHSFTSCKHFRYIELNINCGFSLYIITDPGASNNNPAHTLAYRTGSSETLTQRWPNARQLPLFGYIVNVIINLILSEFLSK